MPELPDLEVFSDNLTKMLKGKKLEKIEVHVASKLNVSTAELKKRLTGQKVKKVYRSGKELQFEFSEGDVLAMHLMLHGKLVYAENDKKITHEILTLVFDDESSLALTDWQAAATPTLNPEEKDVPDALSKEMNFTYLKEQLQTKRQIKKVLMDQKIIRGIGNAYADEILWDAGISPFSLSNKIPDDAIKELIKSIRKVLEQAMKEIKKAEPNIIAGEIRNFLVIHNSSKKESPTKHAIEHTSGAGKTYYTDEQVLYK